MAIQILKHEAQFKFPQLSVMMGSPKIGKSTQMAKLSKSLILDVEGIGYEQISTDALIKTTDVKSIKEAVKYFFSSDNTEYKALIIDHLKELSYLLDQEVSKRNQVEFSSDIDYGKGHLELKYRIYGFLKRIIGYLSEHPDKIVIIVAHVIKKDNDIKLDIDGKNESLVLSLVDAIGYIDRDIDDNLIIDFQARKGFESGTRNPYLAKYKGMFDWKTLFKVAKGEVVEEVEDGSKEKTSKKSK